MPQSGELVFIVGGTSGLGLALAQAAASLGASVTIAGRGAERAAQVARSLSAGARSVHIDLLDSGSITEALRGDEPIDHLVLTPVHPGNQSVREFDAEEALRAVRVKLRAPRSGPPGGSTGLSPSVRTELSVSCMRWSWPRHRSMHRRAPAAAHGS